MVLRASDIQHIGQFQETNEFPNHVLKAHLWSSRSSETSQGYLEWNNGAETLADIPMLLPQFYPFPILSKGPAFDRQFLMDLDFRIKSHNIMLEHLEKLRKLRRGRAKAIGRMNRKFAEPKLRKEVEEMLVLCLHQEKVIKSLRNAECPEEDDPSKAAHKCADIAGLHLGLMVGLLEKRLADYMSPVAEDKKDGLEEVPDMIKEFKKKIHELEAEWTAKYGRFLTWKAWREATR
ncbi:hypothetical protein LTR28_001591, partial [Elasticomyces elasticus]